MGTKYDIGSIDLDAQLIDLNRNQYEDSLYLFLKAAWNVIDPSRWQDSWAIDAVAEHLQAVCDGEIRRLIINISPRCSKSSLVSVAYPAWTWAQPVAGPTSGPQVPFLYASYANQLSLRDSVKCRRLIESEFYKRHWGDRYSLLTDQSTKSRFANTKGGERLITSIDGATTGEGSQILVGDDLNAASEAFSEATIEATISWWDTVASTRLNDPKTGAYIVIQQRLAENDITGHILEKSAGDWCHLMIPMRYERDRAYFIADGELKKRETQIGWSDPRTDEGELMWPERFGETEVKALETIMGPFASSGQLQQNPQPKGGGIIKDQWWKLWDQESYPQLDYVLAGLDTAYTSSELNDPSGMIVWGVFRDQRPWGPSRLSGHRGTLGDPDLISTESTQSEFAPKVIMLWAWDSHLELHELVEKVAATCAKFKVDNLLVENKASGISVAQEIRRLYNREPFGVELFDPKSQDKTARLYSVQHLFAEGIIYAPERPWAQRVITQVAMHPKGVHDEYVDVTSMCLRKLRDIGLLIRQPEREVEAEQERQYQRAPPPLYSV